MAVTQLADVIVPSKFLPYMIERTATLAAFVQSGIIARNAEFDSLVSAAGGIAGAVITMPFWTDISAAAAVLSDTTALTTQKIDGTKADATAKQGRGTAYSANQLVPLLAEGDPLAAIASLFAAYWAREDQTTLIKMLTGVFLANAADNSSDLILAIGAEATGSVTDATKLTGSTFIDATQKLGDAGIKLTAIAMHSAVEASLRKADLIDFIPDSEGKSQVAVFQGRRVIVDDSMPSRAGTTSGTVYTSYLFGPGAFAHGEADLSAVPVEAGFGSYGLEMARSAGVGDTQVFNRRIFLLHPRGFKWLGASVAGKFPTNTELALAANWSRVFEKKNTRLVQVTHNA